MTQPTKENKRDRIMSPIFITYWICLFFVGVIGYLLVGTDYFIIPITVIFSMFILMLVLLFKGMLK